MKRTGILVGVLALTLSACGTGPGTATHADVHTVASELISAGLCKSTTPDTVDGAVAAVDCGDDYRVETYASKDELKAITKAFAGITGQYVIVGGTTVVEVQDDNEAHRVAKATGGKVVE